MCEIAVLDGALEAEASAVTVSGPVCVTDKTAFGGLSGTGVAVLLGAFVGAADGLTELPLDEFRE
jgi:hypothetical protein